MSCLLILINQDNTRGWALSQGQGNALCLQREAGRRDKKLGPVIQSTKIRNATVLTKDSSKQLFHYIHAAAKSFQSCPSLCNPIDGSSPAPPSLGFSRREHWSGLPFPSPVHESEKWKWSCSVVSDSSRPHGLQPTRLLHPWDFSRQEFWSGLPLPSLPLYP